MEEYRYMVREEQEDKLVINQDSDVSYQSRENRRRRSSTGQKQYLETLSMKYTEFMVLQDKPTQFNFVFHN